MRHERRILLAQHYNHHPELQIKYGPKISVRVAWFSHHANKITV